MLCFSAGRPRVPACTWRLFGHYVRLFVRLDGQVEKLSDDCYRMQCTYMYMYMYLSVFHQMFSGCSFMEYVNKHHSTKGVPPVVASKVTGKGSDTLDSFSDDHSGVWVWVWLWVRVHSCVRACSNIYVHVHYSPEKDNKFYPSNTSFPRGVASIPHNLLEDVVKCYSDVRKYCMVSRIQ